MACYGLYRSWQHAEAIAANRTVAGFPARAEEAAINHKPGGAVVDAADPPRRWEFNSAEPPGRRLTREVIR